MKKLFILLLTVTLFASCSTYKCYPSKKSKDYAKRQWMKQRSDGYWVVTTERMNKRTDIAFECKPDSATLASL